MLTEALAFRKGEKAPGLMSTRLGYGSRTLQFGEQSGGAVTGPHHDAPVEGTVTPQLCILATAVTPIPLVGFTRVLEHSASPHCLLAPARVAQPSPFPRSAYARIRPTESLHSLCSPRSNGVVQRPTCKIKHTMRILVMCHSARAAGRRTVRPGQGHPTHRPSYVQQNV